MSTNNKTKVVFLIRDLHYGGAERQLVTLVKGLDKQVFEATILTFYSGGSLEEELKDSHIQVISLNKQDRWDILGFSWRLVKQIMDLSPDVLHGYIGIPNLFAVILKLFFPYIKIVWGIRASDRDLDQYDWLVQLLFPVECFFSHFANLIIINSYAGRTYYLTHGFPAKKTIVISNGIDTDRFKPDFEARANIRGEWGISENTILIGRVGRLDPIKDYPTFLKAAALLCQEREDVHFVCVGGGSENYVQTLYQLAEELGISQKVTWTGSWFDMSAVYNSLDIAVSSSSSEGFPNVLGEAMACGVPCIATDVGDSAQIVSEMGVVVSPKNPEELKMGMQKLIERLNTHYYDSESTRQRIADYFSVSQLISKTESVLLNIVHD